MKPFMHAWQRLSLRDRLLLKVLAVFLLVVLAVQGLWRPTHQRLIQAEQRYQQQQRLARQVQLAEPGQAPQAQPLSTRVSESALAAGLDLQQIEVESGQLRLTLSGEAQTLLAWLAALERDAGALHMLTLEKRGAVLEARLVLSAR